MNPVALEICQSSASFTQLNTLGSDKSELTFIERLGIELISFEKVLQELCSNKPGELFCGAGTDIAEIVQHRSEMLGDWMDQFAYQRHSAQAPI